MGWGFVCDGDGAYEMGGVLKMEGQGLEIVMNSL